VSDLLAARSQMAMSLGFHIVFAVVGMALPVLMAMAEWRWLRTGNDACRLLAQRWAKGAAILFAVGAVSGTVLSFELGLLWPHFMERAGPLIGMPFSLEGVAFFTEAIFLGVYLYGWDRISRTAHFVAGIVVAASGLASGVFVVAVNGFMNTPAGFTLDPATGALMELDLFDAFFNPAFPTEAAHMALAAYASVAFAVLGIHAWRYARVDDDVHRAFHVEAMRIAFVVAAVAMPLQLLSGDRAAKHIAVHQPIKLAAAEGIWDTQKGAPFSIGGIPDDDAETTHFAIHVPYALSFLATGDFNGEVVGLKSVRRDERPPSLIVHFVFQVMIGCGMAMLGLVGLGMLFITVKRRGPWEQLWFRRAALLCAPLGVIAVEAGWVVTEVGRQPWIIANVLRTKDAVTPMPNLIVPFMTFTALYVFLGLVVVFALRRHVFQADRT
jgi:cytochrome bd ubiquinol oxidase subunit I